MTWVAFVLVALALTAVLIYLFVLRWRKMARHGRLALPCDEVITLPAGEIGVYYEDRARRRFSEQPVTPGGLSVLVSDAGSGERLDLGNPTAGTATKGSSRTRIPYASLSVPRAGRYRVVAQLTGDAEEVAITFS
jgi:hypothetical protein